MIEFFVIPVFLSLMILLAGIVLIKLRARFADWPILYRVALSALIASFSPTLVVAGLGGMPLPTISGVILTIVDMDSLADFRMSIIGIGSSNATVLTLPFIVCFLLTLVVACTKFRNRSPVMKPSRPW